MLPVKMGVGRSSVGAGSSRATPGLGPLLRGSSELWRAREIGIETKTNTLM